MLAEQLLLQIPGIQFLQFNTDGMTYKYDNKYQEIVEKICNDWCVKTKLDLEHVNYSKMVIVDVNNYIAIKEGYKPEMRFEKDYKEKYVKLKGLFDYNVDYHKNPSFLVIPKALEAYYVDNIDYREYILSNREIYDFCAGIKKKKDFELNYYYVKDSKPYKEPQQKVTRYFCSKSGGILMKDYLDGRQISIESEQIVTIVNRISSDIDYISLLDFKYYINETQRIVQKINKPKELLLL